MKYIKTIIFSLIIFVYACDRGFDIDNSPDIRLQFSTDTVMFDTIFSGIGSTTKHFMVYNNSSKDIEIDRIFLSKHQQSNYNINIDGSAQKSCEKVLIKAKDSMYVFVDLLINTNQNALLVKDSVFFITNGNRQNIKLIAWGQDVNLINNKTIKSATWTKQKPYLIYNSVTVDTNAVLNIEEGTKIYFHKGAKMYVAGTLKINGSAENPVVLQADRLEKDYSDVPGQWQGVYFLKSSKNNLINHAKIKNAFAGIDLEKSADAQQSTLSLHNTRILHCSYAGIFSRGSIIFATNCLIADCGYFILSLDMKGNYNFYNCTFANYWQNSIRNTASVVLNNHNESSKTTILNNTKKIGFYNCIIYGNHQNEIMVDKYQSDVDVNFENCLIKCNKIADLNANNVKNCANDDPLFADVEKYQFSLDSLSPAINAASRKIVDKYPEFLNSDINNVSRIADQAPDIGAFEFAN